MRKEREAQDVALLYFNPSIEATRRVCRVYPPLAGARSYLDGHVADSRSVYEPDAADAPGAPGDSGGDTLHGCAVL